MTSFVECFNAIAAQTRFAIVYSTVIDVESRSETTKTIALGGILLTASVVTLFFASFIPGAELSFYALSSLFPVVMVLERKSKGGWLFFFSSLLLAAIVVPNKLSLLPYAFFFGHYGLLKYHIESIGKRFWETVLKLLVFNASIATGILIFGELFLQNLGLPSISLIVVGVAAQLFFLLYDNIMTLLIQYYQKRFRFK